MEDNKKSMKKLIIIYSSVTAVLLIAAIIAIITLGGGSKKSDDDKNVAEQTLESTKDTKETKGTKETKKSGEDSKETPEGAGEAQTEEAGKETSAKPDDETNPSGNESGETDPTKPQPTVEPSKEPSGSGEIKITITQVGSWGENPVFKQLAGTVYNGTDKVLNGWTVKVNVGAGAAINQGWSGGYEIKDGILTALPVDYNKNVDPGQSTEFGLIISGITGDLSATIEAGGFSENQNNNNNNNNNNNQNQNNNNNKENTGALPVPEATANDWLHTDGRRILDMEGNEVWLTGCNWFGYNTGTNTFDGLWNCDLNSSLKAIADHGFNLLRVPISAELLLQWKSGEYPSANFNHATNFYLEPMNSLEIFDYVIGQCRANGIKIMIDIHCAKTDAQGHNYNVWYNGNITTEKFQEALCWVAERYKNDDTILILDLKNEPHGKPYEGDAAAIWNDSAKQNNWKNAAQETALKVLEINPNLLVAVEGIEIYPKDIASNGDYHSKDEKDYDFNWWGGNLRGVKDYPIDLGKYQSKLIYSPHDYGPKVYKQPWFEKSFDYDSLMKDCWRDNWFYIYEDEIAPLLIGEWGGFMYDEDNLKWMTHCRELIAKYHLNHTFWCFNSNSGDTGGLVKDDFVTWDQEKYDFVKEVLWQKDGKFVGLDHDIPLGTAGNGISLSEYY